MRYHLAVTAAALTLVSFAPQVQAAAATAASTSSATLASGATVTGSDGQPVGTVISADATTIVIDTGNNKVPVPANAIASDGKGGGKAAVTKAQLDQLAEQQKVQIATQVKSAAVAGAQVRGAAGNVLGTVKQADADYITVTGAKGDARLPVSAFTVSSGSLVIGFTQEQFDAAVAAVAATPPAAP